MKITEEQFIEMTDTERKEYLGKVEVLDKVKKLLLLPNTELSTTKMVAEWYEVDQDAIRKLVERNKEELNTNGHAKMSYKEIKEMILNRDIMSQLKISRNGTNVFSKRAVLNVGMLLRDSEVAKRVRTALLDQQEVITDEQKVQAIDYESQLILNVVLSTNQEDSMMAMNKYRNHVQRHVNELEEIIEEQKPKAETYDTFMDGSNLKKINDVGKSLGVGRNTLYAFLRKQKILMKDNIPYQQYVNNGYFKVKTYPIQMGDKIVNNSQTFATAKGMDYINKMLNKHGVKRNL